MTEQNLMLHWAGIVSLIVFLAAYSLVIAEETIHLRKSKPVMVAGGIIWAFAAIAYMASGQTATFSVFLAGDRPIALVPSTNALVETQRRAIERMVRNELGGTPARL